MTEFIVIASGLGRVIDAAVVQIVLMFGGACVGIWLLSWIQRPVSRRERIAMVVFCACTIALAVLVWEGGRIADDRRREDDAGESVVR